MHDDLSRWSLLVAFVVILPLVISNFTGFVGFLLACLGVVPYFFLTEEYTVRRALLARCMAQHGRCTDADTMGDILYFARQPPNSW